MSAIFLLNDDERAAIFELLRTIMDSTASDIQELTDKLIDDHPLEKSDTALVLLTLKKGLRKTTSLDKARLYRSLIARLS